MRRTLLMTVCVALLAGCVAEDFNAISDSFSPPTPGEAARMASNRYDADERREGLTLLANAPFGGTPTYVEYYRMYVVEEHDPLVRAAAIKALGRFGAPEDAIIIIPWLSRVTSESVQVRREAALALQRLHNPTVVPDLLRSLADEGEEGGVRSPVATALGQYPEGRVLSGLMLALQANKLSINLSAAESLHLLTGQSFGIDGYAWVDWYSLQAKGGINPFTGQLAYQYPTYQRQERWWDKLAFWEQRPRERPGVPAGLRESTRRKTWDEEPGIVEIIEVNEVIEEAPPAPPPPPTTLPRPVAKPAVKARDDSEATIIYAPDLDAWVPDDQPTASP